MVFCKKEDLLCVETNNICFAYGIPGLFFSLLMKGVLFLAVPLEQLFLEIM